jgi:predicted ATPase/DNA-binding CsgD family transcriptional regulator
MHGFAPALTTFVGRDRAVAEVAGLLEKYRLVTVTGAGGSGKTRLTAEVVRQVAGRYDDGVWLAELAGVSDPAQVPRVVAAALGVREQPAEGAAGALARVLAQRQMLLVLDNCEHVIGVAAELCALLLSACDDVGVLATSREPLRVAGEARYRLAPLSLPGPDDPDGAESEAVALFADRARRAYPELALAGEAAPAVARLVRRLDGMPLAIELAAARVDALGVTQMLDCLDDRFALLTAGDRLAPDRQQSLAATVGWSYGLLEKRERAVFRAVSVLPGPFTLEAAQAVAGPDAGVVVLHLVDCSLAVPPRADPDGRSRYVLLETLRTYGRWLLADAGEQQQAEAALAGYALEVAEEAGAGLQTGTCEVPAARWLNAEDATMRQALAWALEHDHPVAVRLAVALAAWWYRQGQSTDGYPLLREAAGHAAAGSDEWCTAHYWLGRMALHQAELSAALGHFSAVVDVVADQAPSRTLADCLSGRSMALGNLGRIPEAIEDGRRALAVAGRLGYPVGEIRALVGLNHAARYAGDLDGALQTAEQAQQVRADLPAFFAHGRSNTLMKTLILTGDLAGAERICAAELARARDDGDQQWLAIVLTNTATVNLLAERFDDAAAHLRESLQLATHTGHRMEMLNGLNWSGHLCAATARPADAVTVWAACGSLASNMGFGDSPADAARRDEPLRQARLALGEARARAAEERGVAMSLPTAAEYALMLITAGPQPPVPAAVAGLSAREQELVTLVARGRTDAQIAAELFISPRTVSSHLDRIRDKTGARRRVDLTRLALTAGLV